MMDKVNQKYYYSENVAEEYERVLREQNNIEMLNKLKYIKSYVIVRKLYLSGEIDVTVLERLNNRNAKTLNCVPLDFKCN